MRFRFSSNTRHFASRGFPMLNTGTKSKVATSPLRSWGLTCEQNDYPCHLGDPQRQAQGGKQKWLPNPCHISSLQKGKKSEVAP